MDTDNLVYILLTNGVNIDPLCNTDPQTETPFGVRLRFYGKKWPEKKMVLGKGATFNDALTEAAIKVRDGRLEDLNWRARPWAEGESDLAGALLLKL